MAPKSFKSKEVGENAYGVSPKQSDFGFFEQLTPEHFYFGVDQLSIDSNEQISIKWSPPLDAKDPDYEVFALDDNVAITIDTNSQVLLAIVTDVVQVDNQWQAKIAEWSSKPFLSAAWEKFLKELKKCGCGHHNKKQKTLLHVVKIAKAIKPAPESIQLTVRPTALANAQNNWQYLVAQIQTVIDEAAVEGLDLDLRQIENFFQRAVVLVDADYAPKKARFEAMTYVMNGVPLRRQSILGSIETISIPKEKLMEAATFHTGDPLPLSNPEVKWFLNIYNHRDDLIVHNNRSIENISVSQDGSEYILKLEAVWDWVVRAAPAMANIDNALITMFGYKAVADSPAEVDPTSGILEHKFRPLDAMLAIGPDRYELLTPDSDDGQHRLRLFTHRIPIIGSKFEEGDNYWVSGYGYTQSLVRVESVITDPVERTATVEFSYQGGDKFEAGSKGVLSMKRTLTLIASAKKPEEIKLTLERAAELDEPAAALLDGDSDGNDGDGDVLKEIADGINQLLQDDPDNPDNPGVSLSELADWVEQNPAHADLMVTRAEYQPGGEAYEASSSVTGGIGLDVWVSENGKYTYWDLLDIADIMSMVYRSTLKEEGEESEVKEETVINHLDQIREAKIQPARLREHVLVSVYNGEKGIAVCNNEVIWRILRKKKDGKCIYRIFVKNGARANQIVRGKHRKCIMYLDRLYRVDHPVI
jgi:hypothetical protein